MSVGGAWFKPSSFVDVFVLLSPASQMAVTALVNELRRLELARLTAATSAAVHHAPIDPLSQTRAARPRATLRLVSRE